MLIQVLTNNIFADPLFKKCEQTFSDPRNLYQTPDIYFVMVGQKKHLWKTSEQPIGMLLFHNNYGNFMTSDATNLCKIGLIIVEDSVCHQL